MIQHYKLLTVLFGIFIYLVYGSTKKKKGHLKHYNALVDCDQTGDSVVCNKVSKTKTKDGTASGVARGSGMQSDTSYVNSQFK